MSCLKKVSFSVATLAVSASAFAGTDIDFRVRALEKEMKQVRTETMEKTYGANTASARPSGETGFALSFDVLYWQLKAGGTEYCYTDNTNTSTEPYALVNGADLPINGSLKDIDFGKWEWGFRAGLGYNFEHGEWDAYLNYTYFNESSSSHTSTETSGTVYVQPDMSTVLANPSSTGFSAPYAAVRFVNKATSQYKFSLNRIDLELGRDFFVARHLALRPHIGLMTAWIRQHQTSRYTGLDLGNNTATVYNQNHFWGIGPRGGINTKWYLCNGFHIMGNMSGALTYGRFDMSYQRQFSLVPTTNQLDLDADMHRFTPNAQMQLGIGYDSPLSCDTQRISIWLGWDIQYWWRIQQQLKPGLGYARLGEDMSLQGVTLHLRWDY